MARAAPCAAAWSLGTGRGTWALRRAELCDPGLCPDAPEDGGRCDRCPLDKLDAAQSSQRGLVIRRALDLMSALKLGVSLAILIIAEERDVFERERLHSRSA